MSQSADSHNTLQASPTGLAPITVSTETRDPKRRKILHDAKKKRSQTRPHTPQKKRQATVKKKRLHPRPPRAVPSLAVTFEDKILLAEVWSKSPKADIATLISTKFLLDKIWIRSKNQHHTQSWWRTLSMLRKSLTNLCTLDKEEKILTQGQQRSVTAEDFRRRFEQQSDIRRRREVWKEWTREVLVPKAYLGFSILVGDKQFANLGVVLMSILADLAKLVGCIRGSDDENRGDDSETKISGPRISPRDPSSGQARHLTATTLRVTGLRSGELLERNYDSDDQGEIVERRTNQDKVAALWTSATEDEAATGDVVEGVDVEGPLGDDEMIQQSGAGGERARVSRKDKRPESATEEREATGDTVERGGLGRPIGAGEMIQRADPDGKRVRPRYKKKKSKSTVDDIFAGLC